MRVQIRTVLYRSLHYQFQLIITEEYRVIVPLFSVGQLNHCLGFKQKSRWLLVQILGCANDDAYLKVKLFG